MYILQAFGALVIASLCTYVEGFRWWTHREVLNPEKPFKLTSREIKDYETSLFKVECKGNCIVTDIQVSDYTGTLELSAESATTIICNSSHLQTSEDSSGKKSRCPYRKSLTEQEFFIYLKPNPSFSGGELQVKLENKQTGTIYEIRHEGATLASPNFVQINSGYHPVKYPKLLPQYRITCNGNCRNLEIEGRGDNVIIVAANEPLLVKKGICHNSFCQSSGQGSMPLCKEGDTSSFNLQSNSFYITLLPNQEAKDFTAFVKGSSFKSITRVSHRNRLENYTAIYHFYPQKQGFFLKKTMLGVFCLPSYCKDVKIDLMGGPKLKTMRVGKLDEDGNCVKCSYNGPNYQGRLDPKYYWNFFSVYYFDLYMEAEKGEFISPAYVRVSGKNVQPPFIDSWGPD